MTETLAITSCAVFDPLDPRSARTTIIAAEAKAIRIECLVDSSSARLLFRAELFEVKFDWIHGATDVPLGIVRAETVYVDETSTKVAITLEPVPPDLKPYPTTLGGFLPGYPQYRVHVSLSTIAGHANSLTATSTAGFFINAPLPAPLPGAIVISEVDISPSDTPSGQLQFSDGWAAAYIRCSVKPSGYQFDPSESVEVSAALLPAEHPLSGIPCDLVTAQWTNGEAHVLLNTNPPMPEFPEHERVKLIIGATSEGRSGSVECTVGFVPGQRPERAVSLTGVAARQLDGTFGTTVNTNALPMVVRVTLVKRLIGFQDLRAAIVLSADNGDGTYMPIGMIGFSAADSAGSIGTEKVLEYSFEMLSAEFKAISRCVPLVLVAHTWNGMSFSRWYIADSLDVTNETNVHAAPAFGRSRYDSQGLSGSTWCDRYKDSSNLSDLEPNFRERVLSFLDFLDVNHIQFDQSSIQTRRPLERAYLMHCAWRIARLRQHPTAMPIMAGVDIQWNHAVLADSIDAADRMVTRFGMKAIEPLRSKQTEGRAACFAILETMRVFDVSADRHPALSAYTPAIKGMELREIAATFFRIRRSAIDPAVWEDRFE